MYKKALVAVDGSGPSLEAVATARDLLKEGSLQSFSLINVIPFPYITNVGEGLMMFPIPIDFEQQMKSSAQEIMEQSLKIAGSDLQLETLIEFGAPAETILQAAEKGLYDLIIIGNRGLNQVKRLFLGSVSTRVVSLADCAVLVVKL